MAKEWKEKSVDEKLDDLNERLGTLEEKAGRAKKTSISKRDIAFLVIVAVLIITYVYFTRF